MTSNLNKAKCKDLDMALITNLKGRVRNLALPKSKALMPVFEAIVNSIHSIEENKEATLVDDGVIQITIVRDGINDNLFDKKMTQLLSLLLKIMVLVLMQRTSIHLKH